MKNEDLRGLNDLGKRIQWVRKKLELNLSDVSKDTGIPASNYYGREQGVRTYYFEEYLILAEYFNSKWSSKFNNHFPKYNGNQIKKIHVLWIMFGIQGDI